MSVAAADVQEGHAGLAQAGMQATGGSDLDRASKMRMVVDDAKELLVALAQRSDVLQVVKFGQQPRTGICVPKDPVDGRSRTSSQWILARRALAVRLVRGGVATTIGDIPTELAFLVPRREASTTVCDLETKTETAFHLDAPTNAASKYSIVSQ